METTIIVYARYGLFAIIIITFIISRIANILKVAKECDMDSARALTCSLVAALPPVIWITMLLTGVFNQYIIRLCSLIWPTHPVLTAILIPSVYFLVIVGINRLTSIKNKQE